VNEPRPLVPPDVAAILRCPVPACRGRFTEDRERRCLVCAQCHREFRVDEEGIVHLLVEDLDVGCGPGEVADEAPP